MEQNDRRSARQRLVAAMLAGQSWQDIARTEAVPVKRAMAYRLVQAVRTRGEEALADGRHGHPSKLRGEARVFLESQCQQAPSTPSSTLKLALQERFDLQVSVSQINRVRATLGVSNHPKPSPQEKNRRSRMFLLISRVGGWCREFALTGCHSGNTRACQSGNGSFPKPFHN